MRSRIVLVMLVLALSSACSAASNSSTVTTEVGPVVSSTTTESSVTTVPAPTSVPSTSTTTTTTVPAAAPAPSRPQSTGDLARAQANGVPGSNGAVVVASGCWGRTDRTHWGYYNYLGTGSTVVEPDGAVVEPGWICLNPSQPSTYSSLVHELGHRWFWENGLWDRVAADYGSYQRASECFAAVWGATVFGSGGCPADQVAQMRAEFGW